MTVRLKVLPNDYAEAYKWLDSGKVKGCLGAECPNSCCAKQNVTDDKGKTHRYRTTLLDEAEYQHQMNLERRNPKLKKIGVRIKEITVQGVRWHLVSGCLRPGEGCKLEAIGRKPTTCRVFPLGMPFGSTVQGEDHCPAREDILNQNADMRRLTERVDEVLKISATRANTRRAIREAGNILRDSKK